MSFFDTLASTANAAYPNVILHCAEASQWSSGSPDYRMLLRKALEVWIEQNFPHESNETTLNLKTLPTYKNLFVSISHCPDFGAFIIGQKPVGIDLESAHRVRPEIVERICKDQELKLTPDHAALWCAKEALFKCHRTLKLISDTHILSWKTSQNGIHVFNDTEHVGWVQHFQSHYSALVVKKA